MVTTKSATRQAKNFSRQVKAAAVLGGLSMQGLAEKIDRKPSTLSWSLREPWRFPLVVQRLEKFFKGKVAYAGPMMNPVDSSKPAPRKARQKKASTR